MIGLPRSEYKNVSNNGNSPQLHKEVKVKLGLVFSFFFFFFVIGKVTDLDDTSDIKSL